MHRAAAELRHTAAAPKQPCSRHWAVSHLINSPAKGESRCFQKKPRVHAPAAPARPGSRELSHSEGVAGLSQAVRGRGELEQGISQQAVASLHLKVKPMEDVSFLQLKKKIKICLYQHQMFWATL